MENYELFVLLGTNEGNRKKNLADALLKLENTIGPIVKKSSIYQTSAWGKTDQMDFLNQAICFVTKIPSKDILNLIHQIEESLGRVRMVKWGERIIDIDILYAGNQIIDEASLQIPHPQIPNRRFTLVPLNEIASDFIHPVLNKTTKEMLQDCMDNLAVTLFKH